MYQTTTWKRGKMGVRRAAVSLLIENGVFNVVLLLKWYFVVSHFFYTCFFQILPCFLYKNVVLAIAFNFILIIFWYNLYFSSFLEFSIFVYTTTPLISIYGFFFHFWLCRKWKSDCWEIQRSFGRIQSTAANYRAFEKLCWCKTFFIIN